MVEIRVLDQKSVLGHARVRGRLRDGNIGDAMNARLWGTSNRAGGASAMALGLLLLAELALAVLLSVMGSYVPPGPDEGLGFRLLTGLSITFIHIAFAIALVSLLYAMPVRPCGRSGRPILAVALTMALAGAVILAAAFGFSLWTSVASSGATTPGPDGWTTVVVGAGPFLFMGGLGLFGLAASGDRTVERSASLRTGSVMVLAGSATPALWLLAVTLPYGQSLTVPLYGPVIVLVILFLPLGLVLLGIGLARLGWLLVQASKTRPRDGTGAG